MKTCTQCGETKPLDAFSPKVQRGVHGHHSWCKACKAVVAKAIKAAKKEKREVYGYVYPKPRVKRQPGSMIGRIEAAIEDEITSLAAVGSLPTTNRKRGLGWER